MLLGKVIKNINYKYKSIRFKNIKFNSNDCKLNDIFFAISGNIVNGKSYRVEAGKSYEIGPENVDDDGYQDGQFTLDGIRLMNHFSASDQPFFLAVGFKKPHLPCASKYRPRRIDESIKAVLNEVDILRFAILKFINEKVTYDD